MNNLDVLLKEYQAIREEVITTMRSRITILSSGLISISIALAASVASYSSNSVSTLPSLILISIIPAITSFVLFVWLGEYQRMQRAGKYLVSLENKINGEATKQLLSWETQLREQHRHMRYPYNTTALLLILISIVSLLIGVFTLQPTSNFVVGSLIAGGVILHFLVYRYVTFTVEKLRQ